MNRFYKFIFALSLLLSAASVTLRAATPAAAAVETAKAAEAGPLVTEYAPTMFHIGPLPITNSMIYGWIAVITLCVFVQLATRKMNEVPTGIQNLLEAMIEGWDNLSNVILEPKVSRWVCPVAVSFFFFALTSNLLGLLPGVGSIGYGPAAEKGTTFSSLPFAIEHAERPLLRPATADANMTVVMALIFLVMSFVWALRYNGPIGLIKHVFGVKVDANKWVYPLLFLMFLFVGLMETLSIVFVRPLALAVRLYGNIYAGESLLAMMMTTKPFLAGLAISLPFYFFELFVAVVQAFVFAMLTLAFVGTLCSHADEEHEH